MKIQLKIVEKSIRFIEKMSLQKSGILVERKLSEEEIKERYEWINEKKSKPNSSTTKNYDQSVRKVNFPDTLFGLYSVKFSLGGDLIATAYGSGCIQVRKY